MQNYKMLDHIRMKIQKKNLAIVSRLLDFFVEHFQRDNNVGLSSDIEATA
jgi:hypothetical protein